MVLNEIDISSPGVISDEPPPYSENMLYPVQILEPPPEYSDVVIDAITQQTNTELNVNDIPETWGYVAVILICVILFFTFLAVILSTALSLKKD